MVPLNRILRVPRDRCMGGVWTLGRKTLGQWDGEDGRTKDGRTKDGRTKDAARTKDARTKDARTANSG